MSNPRLKPLNTEPVNSMGRLVVYWMQQAQRAYFNHALEYAIRRSNELGLPLIVGFGLMDPAGQSNLRHYMFMMEGLAETARRLETRGIKFVMRRGAPEAVALELAKDAALVVCDRGYLREQRAARRRLASAAGRQVVEVDTDTVVPIDLASTKAEYAARTIRPKLLRQLDDFIQPLPQLTPVRSSLELTFDGALDSSTPDEVLDLLPLSQTVAPVMRFRGGTSRARARLRSFIENHLAGYAEGRNDPAAPQCSNLSPYLHFGQISPVEVAHQIGLAKTGSREDKAKFMDELVVRRELSINYVTHAPNYDSFDAVPQWARRTLEAHAQDPRPHLYGCRQLERCQTHDVYWNAAMREMVTTGYMHNYMRMYWGKKILEWSRTPKQGFGTTLYLNNKYFIDGRDANSYAGVAWIYGLHDRPWKERPIFGTVRYMAAGGLERKFDIQAYVRWTGALG